MKTNPQKIQSQTNDIQYVTDHQGNRIFVQIPFTQWELIQNVLFDESGAPENTESPTIVEEHGIFVVEAEPLRDLTNITKQERNRRLVELLQRVQL
jgi:hypothetical protein